MPDSSTIFVIDRCRDTRHSISEKLAAAGYTVLAFAAVPDFLRDHGATEASCVIADTGGEAATAPLAEILRRGCGLPVIAAASGADVSLVVKAMKAGAIDFLEKPVDDAVLLASVARAIDLGKGVRGQTLHSAVARRALESLTPREREVLCELVAGHSNKRAAAVLGISSRTVEIHRSRIMSKTNARSFSALVRLAFAAAQHRLGATNSAVAA